MADASSEDIWDWACKCADAFFPAAIPKFPIQRWVTSLGPLQSYTLLTAFNILQQAVPRWIADLQGKPMAPLNRRDRQHQAHSGSRWSLQSSDEEQEEAPQDMAEAADLVVVAAVDEGGSIL
jgi:hypothetical protein